MPPVQPIYLEAGDQQSLALFDAPEEGENTGASVLICPPWGWDEVASYRARRDWARRLAGKGHPALRLVLPATGDSGGSPADPGLVGAWVGAIGAAARWLKEAGAGAPVVGLGLGLGGLLALEALAAGAPIDEMALWGAPVLGRAFVRETKAFSRLQAWHSGGGGAELDAGLPEGWLEAGGFLLSPETLASLGSLGSKTETPAGLRRALLLGRDGIAADAGLGERLERGGTAVTVATGTGWGAMVSHPERSQLPAAVATTFEDWLGGAAAAGATDGVAPAAESIRLEVGGSAIQEAPFPLEQPWGRPFGMLAAPAGAGQVPDLAAVFLNAGAVREIGPSRMWVETSRAWAARGVPSLRLDLEGIGEADGEPAGALGVADFYAPRYQPQIDAVLDALAERGVAKRFLLVGLCAGGYGAFRTAVADERVGGVVLINSGALRWHPDLLAEREARKASKALQGRSWKKLLSGKVGVRKIGRLAGSLLVRAGRGARRIPGRISGRGHGGTLLRGVEADLDTLRDAGTRVVIAFSGEEPLGHEVTHSAIPGQLEERWPGTELLGLPGTDHTLRPFAAQLAVRELLDRELERQLERAAAPDSQRG